MQERALKAGVDIIVTPGRLMDHMRQQNADLSGVIAGPDEADRMMDMGFGPMSGASSRLFRRSGRHCCSRRRCRTRSCTTR
jgi:superfamily II DNA/RNA helicase